MTTTTLSLADFLLARIAEDEDEARCSRYAVLPDGLWSAHRIAAECDAKRQVVERSVPFRVRDYADMTLRLLALPYADHPHYRQEWKP